MGQVERHCLDASLTSFSTITSTSTTLRPPKKVLQHPPFSTHSILFLISYHDFKSTGFHRTQTETPSQPKVGLTQDPLDTRLFLASPIPRPATCDISFLSTVSRLGTTSLTHGPFTLWSFVLKPSHNSSGAGFRFQVSNVSKPFQHFNISTLDRAIEHYLSGRIAWRLLLFQHIPPYTRPELLPSSPYQSITSLQLGCSLAKFPILIPSLCKFRTILSL